jgi:hypothetical protein
MLGPQNTRKSLFCLSLLAASVAVGVAPVQAATLGATLLR